ncbi:helicase associated domain-containing protein [Arthrobacter sp. NPDC092385]|uniref:helicase associated domain-containing protein n=1 Tax=Arthrobacter sp. NPDC092385 TaxID=3363943 RepID=UPI00381CE95C
MSARATCSGSGADNSAYDNPRRSRAVPARVIADWCRVDVRRVHRTIDKQITLHPEWFDRCWRIHDQPAPAQSTRRYVRTREQAWWEHYDEVATYMRERGGALPAQNDSPRVRVLYRWIEAQRRQHDAGTLAQDRVDALNRLGEWIGTRKGGPEQLWAQRLEEVQPFWASAGRFPYYDPDRHPDEKVLAVWLGRQRTWWWKGQLRADRQESLDRVLPGWNACTASRTTGNGMSDTGMSDTTATTGSGFQ